MQVAAQSESLYSIVRRIYADYWPPGTPIEISDAESARYCHALQVILKYVPAGAHIVDVGGGWAVFAAACAALGYRATTIDDCQDPGWFAEDKRHDIPRDFGVETVTRDVAKDGVDYPPNSVDAFTCFHSIEHWHCSPKKAFHSMMRALKPGGLFFIAGPSANDFAKRLTVLLGTAEWAPWREWYESPVYRSHVHELNVRDLHRIAVDLRLADVSIFGRNSSAFMHPNAFVRAVMRPLDYLFRLRPGLCTEMYLCGFKPKDAS